MKDISRMGGVQGTAKWYMKMTGGMREHFMVNGKQERSFLRERDGMEMDIGR